MFCQNISPSIAGQLCLPNLLLAKRQKSHALLKIFLMVLLLQNATNQWQRSIGGKHSNTRKHGVEVDADRKSLMRNAISDAVSAPPAHYYNPRTLSGGTGVILLLMIISTSLFIVHSTFTPMQYCLISKVFTYILTEQAL